MPTALAGALPGLDALLSRHETALSSSLRSQKLGLLTNQTGLTISNRAAITALREAGFNILALFSPEHGPQGVLEGHIDSSHLEDGTPVHSLYGQTRRPTAAMLTGLDAILCDLQDVGARFYTYAATIFELLEACAPLGIAVVVLDRPNPLGGESIEGPIIDSNLMSFIGPAPLPVTHGLTIGELALFYRDWKRLDVEIQIVHLENWQRGQKWSETGREWRLPSPNLPDFVSAAWYPGLCLLEFSGVSVGRGTEAPFQILGAPDFHSDQFLEQFDGGGEIEAKVIQFTPSHAVFEAEACQGIRFSCPGNIPQRPVELGLCVMAALRASHPDFSRPQWDKAAGLLGSREMLDWLWSGELERALEKSRRDAATFRQQRAAFLLY